MKICIISAVNIFCSSNHIHCLINHLVIKIIEFIIAGKSQIQLLEQQFISHSGTGPKISECDIPVIILNDIERDRRKIISNSRTISYSLDF